MKKFRCYKCGIISSVDDGATQATCSNCGTLCSFTPKAPTTPLNAESKSSQNVSVDANALSAALIRQIAITQLGKCIHRNNFGNLVNAIIRTPIQRVQAALRVPTKSAFITFVLSFFFGGIGVDRFYVGDIGLGICKLLFNLLTFGLWAFIDMFGSYKKAYKKNYIEIMHALGVNVQI